MKKIIFRFSLINIVLGIVLFLLYRVIIDRFNPPDTTTLEKFYTVMDVFMQVVLSSLYLVAIAVSSLLFFLNQIDRVRNNNYLSFLTFSGIPLFFVLFVGVNVALDIDQYDIIPSSIKMLLGFSILYLFCTVVEFLIFRSKIKKLNESL
ncbi:hypothetical protein HMPREF0765_1066 [Sphingobacterium spiritivorum ATCC 33300]|uniref:Uncharacterized protein n=1 Tax=Sphingobacterium spiritivorum ATCC 33300 TaxID=525372 RepID=C2FUR0_SPHSI|nr:hypothetical protein HMPREF0765_1066 [Sphingobacterium spiritivorum ATCC 33300]